MKRASEPPEITQALAKAEEYARLAALAQTAKDRDYYARMQLKWLSIADGWRFIAEVAQAH